MMTVSAVDELKGTSERGAGGDGGQRAGQHRERCRRQHRRLMLECGGVLLQRSLVEKLRWLLEVHMSRGVNLRVERRRGIDRDRALHAAVERKTKSMFSA